MVLATSDGVVSCRGIKCKLDHLSEGLWAQPSGGFLTMSGILECVNLSPRGFFNARISVGST